MLACSSCNLFLFKYFQINLTLVVEKTGLPEINLEVSVRQFTWSCLSFLDAQQKARAGVLYNTPLQIVTLLHLEARVVKHQRSTLFPFTHAHA